MPKVKSTKQNMNSITERLTVPKEQLQKAQERIKHNEPTAKTFRRLSAELDDPVIYRKSENIRLCNSIYSVDKYEKAKIKDLKHTNLCKDYKWCVNCRKIEQIARIARYKNIIRPYNKMIYMITLTAPNVEAETLDAEIDKMNEKFPYLIKYLSGDKKIRDLCFENWGYLGAIRSLEVKISKRKKDFNAHFHVLIVLNHDLDLNTKKHKNDYSKRSKSRNKVRLFSDAEILLQKIWKLLMTDTKVTKKAIDALEIGYNCTIDKYDEDEDYFEIFKYLVKTDDENNNLPYELFKPLYFALKNRRQIQAYGVLNKASKEIIKQELEDARSIYNQFIKYLQKSESPVAEINKIIDLIQDPYTLITRKNLHRILKDLEDHEDLRKYIDVSLLE